MSITEVSQKTRHIADGLAREALGYGKHEYIRPEDKREYRREFSAAVRYLTQGQAYYTANNFYFA